MVDKPYTAFKEFLSYDEQVIVGNEYIKIIACDSSGDNKEDNRNWRKADSCYIVRESCTELCKTKLVKGETGHSTRKISKKVSQPCFFLPFKIKM